MNAEDRPESGTCFPDIYSAGADTVQKATANSAPAQESPARASSTRRRRAEVTTSGPSQEVMDIARGMAEENQEVIPQHDGSALIVNTPPSPLERASRHGRPPTVPKEIVDAVMKLAGDDSDLVTQPAPHTFIIHNHPKT